MQYHEAEFLVSGVYPSQWPNSTLPEIIFAGRSNAGKSSLINSLVNRKNLAYSGKTPGKTRLLNFFEIDHKVIFTDAPGYGYAKANVQSAEQFRRIIDPYFRNREQLKGMVLVLDSRRKPNADDLAMIEYARNAHLWILCVLTKKDKMTQSQMAQSRRIISETLGVPQTSMVNVSSLKKQGLEDVWDRIDDLIEKSK